MNKTEKKIKQDGLEEQDGFSVQRQKIKDIKMNRNNIRNIGYILFVLLPLALSINSCKQTELMTKRLFMQSKRVYLELPSNMVDSTGQAILREDVSYTHEDNTSVVIAQQDSVQKAQKRSLNEVQRLNEVTVTAKVKQKFAPERDGKVSVDFMVRVPRELLSQDWRVTLSPKLLHNDSIVPLDTLVLKGANFLAVQKAGYAAFADYEASIIKESAYDSLFLDHKGIAKDMRKRQEYYWRLYNKEFKKITDYYNWKQKVLDRYAFFNMKKDGYRSNLYHGFMRKQNEETIRLLTTGIDTTGISLKYNNKFEKKAKLFPMYHLHRELTERKVPKKYKAFFMNEPKLEDLVNYSTTEKDSIEIAKHRYFFDQIAENESRDKRRDEMRNRLIHFPMETGMRLDSVVGTETDFVYYYQQSYPVTPGLNRIGITLNGQITAADRSGYTLPKSDTLNYVISSLVQLADTSLIIRKTKLYRNMFDKVTISPQFEVNKSDFKVAYQNNRQEIDSLMSRYHKLTKEMGFRMDSMEVISWASLDGSYDTNYELSQKRAESLSNYLRDNYSADVSSTMIKVIPRGEDWQGFVNELKKRDDIVNKDSIIAKVSRTVYPDQTEQEIRWQYKKDYKIIREHIYPKLRRVDIIFNISRPNMLVTDSIKEEVKEGYAEGLRLLKNRQYWEAIEILKNYPDYNAALCLACMGYNGKAYDLLLKLKESANNEYLLAIVCWRMGKEEEAKSHLLKAIELDPQKAYRTNQDSEIMQLVSKYNLQAQIDALNTWQDVEETDEKSSASESVIETQQETQF